MSAPRHPSGRTRRLVSVNSLSAQLSEMSGAASKSRRLLAALVVVAMVAAACTKNTVDTTTTVVRNSPEAKAMIDAALGGTQAVQDFLIHLDLFVQTENGLVSFYEEVLDQALVGAGPAAVMEDGTTFAAVDSLTGEVVDADGAVLSTVRLDFALAGLTPTLFEQHRDLLTGAAQARGDLDLIEVLLEAEPSRPLLVQIATADYSVKRTHVGLEDVALMDLSNSSAITAGDRLWSVHLFGQTLPGDPQVEEGLTPHELFTYRWNSGLVSVLGDQAGVVLVIDGSIAVVERHGGSSDSAETPSSLTVESRAPLKEAGPQLVALMSNPAVKLTPAVVPEALEFAMAASVKAFALGAAYADGLVEGISIAIGDDGPLIRQCESNIGGPNQSPSPTLPFQDAEGYCLPPGEHPVTIIGLIFAVERCTQMWAEQVRRNGADILVSDIQLLDRQDEPSSSSSTSTSIPVPPICMPPPDPPLPKLPLGALLGDVHVKTFDRLAYSNQAAGEFLLFESGMTAIQMRTEPVEGHDSVSTATAVAVRIGELAVSLHAGGETWIDGELAQLTRGEAIAVGDAALLWWKGGWVVVWPDDTRLEIQDRGSDLAAFVSPSAIPVVGMLGDGDGDPANDLVSRSGDLFQVPPRPSGGYDDAFYDSFYSTYVDSWRITQEESLFHYGPGESTASFTIEGFPARYARVSDLDPQTLVDAEQVCRSGGITREDVLEDCMLDVGLTGDRGFAYTHYLVESRTEPAVRSPVAGPAAPGDGASIVTVGNLSVDFGPNSPLRDPSRSSRWECFADEGQFRAMSTFAESPTRSFDITVLYGSADTNPTGVESFAIVIRLNAEDHAWTGITIDEVQPFAIENLTLDGNTLTAAGTAYLNDPPLANAFPFVLPEGATAQPFALQATCDQ